MPEHTLTIRERSRQVPGPHGSWKLVEGYIGECACGARSDLYGVEEPVRLWHRWHLDPTGRIARGRR